MANFFSSVQNPELDQLTDLSVFDSSKFNLKSWTGNLTSALIEQSVIDSGTSSTFDPTPFIRHFTAALDTLLQHQDTLKREEERHAEAVRSAERQLSRRVVNSGNNQEAIRASFETLEKRIADISRGTSRVGDSLSVLAKAKDRHEGSLEVVQAFSAALNGDTSGLDTMKRQSSEGFMRCAVLLRRLNSLLNNSSDLLKFDGVDKGRDTIATYSEAFEKDTLNLFDRSMRKLDPKMMGRCARILLAFNGASSCIQSYVNQHDFFMSTRDFGVEMSSMPAEIWDALSDPNQIPKDDGVFPLKELSDEICGVVKQEASIIQAVFPDPKNVMVVFLSRVFAQVVQAMAESILSHAQSISTLAYLRTIQMARAEIVRLSSSIKALKMFAKAPPPPPEVAILLPMDQSVNIPSLLDSLTEELFVPYLEGNRYLELESKNLTELYAAYLTKFTRWHARNNKSSGTSSILDRMARQFAAAAEKASANSPRSAAILKLSGLTPADSVSDNELVVEDGLLSFEIAEKIIAWHAEALGRCVEIGGVAELPPNAMALLRVLIETIALSYSEVAIETAIYLTNSQDSKSEPLLDVIAIVNPADQVTQLWQQYVTTAIMPLGSSSMPVKREMLAFVQESIARIQTKINSLVVSFVDVAMKFISSQLKKQKTTDFKPKDEEIAFNRVYTEACTGCCDFLSKFQKAVASSLTPFNRDTVLTEVGVAFHSQLLEHFKKWPVDPMGSIMLLKDISLYQETVARFKIKLLVERFEMLRHLGIVFTSQLDTLRASIESDEYLSRLDSHLLLPYIQQRSDAVSLPKTFLGGSVESIIPTVAINNIANRIGALSLEASNLFKSDVLRSPNSYSRPSTPSSASISSHSKFPLNPMQRN